MTTTTQKVEETVLRLLQSKPHLKSGIDHWISSEILGNNFDEFRENPANSFHKPEVYRRLLEALVNNDISKLSRTPLEFPVSRGDLALAQEEAVPDFEIEPVEPDVNEPVEPKIEKPVANNPGDILAQAIAAIARGVVPAASPTVDLREVERVAAEIMAKGQAETAELMSGLQREMEAKIANIPPSTIQVTAGAKVLGQVDGRVHYKFELLVKSIHAGLNVMLVGPAGTGKSTAAMAAFEAIGLKGNEAISVGPQTSKGDLFGFKDAHGNYQDTALVRKATQGGGLCVDEIDAAHAGVLTGINMVTSNGHIALTHGFFEKHNDFRLVATANTYGSGANRQYVGRNQLDAATLDRYVFIEWPVDEGLEASFVGVKKDSPSFDIGEGGTMTDLEWIQYVHAVRQQVNKLGLRVVVSPRATLFGCALFRQGVGRAHVEEMVLWKGMNVDTVKKIKAGL